MEVSAYALWSVVVPGIFPAGAYLAVTVMEEMGKKVAAPAQVLASVRLTTRLPGLFRVGVLPGAKFYGSNLSVNQEVM